MLLGGLMNPDEVRFFVSVSLQAIFKGGINPHYYCLPILKTEPDRKKLLQCAVDNPKFFLGTDSAPHTVGKKAGQRGWVRATDINRLKMCPALCAHSFLQNELEGVCLWLCWLLHRAHEH